MIIIHRGPIFLFYSWDTLTIISVLFQDWTSYCSDASGRSQRHFTMEEWIALNWGLNKLKSLAWSWERNDTPTWDAQWTETSVSSHSARGRQMISARWHSLSLHFSMNNTRSISIAKVPVLRTSFLCSPLVALSYYCSAYVSIAICRYISFNGRTLLRYLGRDPMTGTGFADFYSIWHWKVMEIAMMHFFGGNTPSKIACVLVAGASSPFPKHTHIA